MILFLQQYYDNFNIFCLSDTYHNLQYIYSNNLDKISFTIVENDDAMILERFVPLYHDEDSDILVLGNKYRSLLPNKINCERQNTWTAQQNLICMSGYPSLEVISSHFDYIRASYNELGLGIHIYAQFWKMPLHVPFICTNNYKIILLHSHCLHEQKHINLDFVIEYYIDQEDILLINVGSVLYPRNHPKYELAHSYCALSAFEFYTVLFQTHEIHIIDAEIAAMVLPLYLQGHFMNTNLNIYDKHTGCRILLSDE